MIEEKKTKGAPRRPWKPYGDELQRRLESCEALPTLEQEADYLEKWGEQNVDLYERLRGPRIRERAKRRLNGVEGYKMARLHHRYKAGLGDN